MKQFICKQEPFELFPKYVALEERLILKLEAVLQQINALGFDADVFVDEKNRGVMDDLTRDGRVDLQDARHLYDLVDQMLTQPPFRKFEGGVAFYPATSAHPPFVHIDVRGNRARWKG